MGARGAPAAPVPRTPVLDRWGRGASLTAVGLSVLVMLGWALDSEILTSVRPDWASEKFNTALSIALLALGTRLVGSRWVWLPVVLVVGLATLTAAQYFWATSFGIDELVFPDPNPGDNPPGRPAAATTACLLLLSAALVALRRGRRVAAEVLVLASAVVATVALLGYVMDTEELYGVGLYSAMAVQTAVSVVLVSFAAAVLIPGGHLSWALTSPGPGGIAMRQLLPVILLGVPLLGSAVRAGEEADLYGGSFRLALMLATTMVLLVLAAVVLARRLEVSDSLRRQAMEQLRSANVRLAEQGERQARRAASLSVDLDRQRSLFHRALIHIDDAVWTVEVNPDRSLSLEFASPSASQLFGRRLVEESDLAGAVVAAVDGDDRPLAEEFFDRVRDGLAADVEVDASVGSGTSRRLWLRATPWRDGERLLCDGIVTDVTQRRRIEEQRERLLRLEQVKVHELEEVNRLRNEFLAVTGHELRTPLTSIRGFAELLSHESGLTEAQRQYVEVIVRRAGQMTDLLEDLYDLSRLSAGMVELDVQSLDLETLVREAVQAHRQPAAAAGIDLLVQAERAALDADPVRVRQVLDNLISNAVKYNEPGGQVVVSAGTEDGMVRIKVVDDGIGISDAELPHIFDRTFRGDAAKGTADGSGLGLSLARALVEAHGGRIAAEPNDERGMTFLVDLPRQRRATGTRVR